MALRHHYAVTTTRAGSQPAVQWFHTFAEADSAYGGVAGEPHDAPSTAGPGYWRRPLAADDGATGQVALDDIGLRHCGPLCGDGGS